MVNTPIPHSLKSEAKKAAKILREFTMPNSKTGPDKLIPVGILAKAKGLAILTVFKAGFLVTARGGSGIVIARLKDELDYSEGWSAPSAIGMAGLGGGFEIGMEVTDFVIILNSQAAVDAFSKGGNLTLGGNFTIAVGPLGRNVEGDVAVRSPAAIYTYSKTKGIFAGISIEGSALIERKDANRKFYGRDIRAYEILAGKVDPPEGCEALYRVMKEHQELAAKAALKLAQRQAAKHADKARDRFVDATGLSLPSAPKADAWRRDSKSGVPSSSASSSRRSSEIQACVAKTLPDGDSRKSPTPDRQAKQVYSIMQHASGATVTGPAKTSVASGRLKGAVAADHSPGSAVALFPYAARLACDLSFNAGDQIEILTRTDKQDDWWEGRLKGRVGIFPANYVKVL